MTFDGDKALAGLELAHQTFAVGHVHDAALGKARGKFAGGFGDVRQRTGALRQGLRGKRGAAPIHRGGPVGRGFDIVAQSGGDGLLVAILRADAFNDRRGFRTLGLAEQFVQAGDLGFQRADILLRAVARSLCSGLGFAGRVEIGLGGLDGAFGLLQGGFGLLLGSPGVLQPANQRDGILDAGHLAFQAVDLGGELGLAAALGGGVFLRGAALGADL